MYFIALVMLVIIDLIWLGVIAPQLYRDSIGHLMADKFNLVAAALFYLLFLVGLVYFVINPAVAKESIRYVIISGMLFGLITYATYDLTNLATLKDWPIKLTMIDLVWGTFLSTSVSIATYYIYLLWK
jgi:uncharacterized membrane protein